VSWAGQAQQKSTAPILQLDVFDYDIASANDFLGQRLLYEYDLLR
jgi:hypothetical protein